MYSEETKQIAIRLRQDEQMSLQLISSQLGIAKSTLSIWLKDYPLDKNVIRSRHLKKAKERSGHGYQPGPSSKYQKMLVQPRCPSDSGRIAESAVYFRMSLLGWEILTSPFDGATSDIVAGIGGSLYKIQVKTARLGKYGRPFFDTTASRYKGKMRYSHNEVDFFAAYFLHTDECYVFSNEEITVCQKSCDEAALEAWWKIDSTLRC